MRAADIFLEYYSQFISGDSGFFFTEVLEGIYFRRGLWMIIFAVISQSCCLPREGLCTKCFECLNFNLSDAKRYRKINDSKYLKFQFDFEITSQIGRGGC